MAHVGRVRRKLQGRRKGAGDDGATEASALNERLSALAAYVLAGNYYDCPWQTFCYGHLKGLSDEEAVKALAGWCRRQGLTMSFKGRMVREVEVLFLLLSSR